MAYILCLRNSMWCVSLNIVEIKKQKSINTILHLQFLTVFVVSNLWSV